MTDFQAQLDQLGQHTAALGAKLATLQQKRSELATAVVLDRDKAATKQLSAIDTETDELRREVALTNDALDQIKVRQAEAAQETERKDRADREQQSRQECEVIRRENVALDALFVKCREHFERRRHAIQRLKELRVVDNYLVNRLGSTFNPTNAAVAAGLRPFLNLSAGGNPEHVKCLSDGDASALLVAPKINGVQNV